MRQKKLQFGNVHVVIIAVLIVALVATLGVVFYQNFIAKKPIASERANQSVVTAPINDTTRIAFNSAIYSLDYPKTWTARNEKIPNTLDGGSITKITNVDGTIRVALSISSASPGGSCKNSDGLKISYYHINPTSVNKLTSALLYLVEAITDSPGGGYQYQIGLTPDGGDTHAVVGDTSCNIAHVGQVSSVVFDGQKLVNPSIFATIDFPKLPVAPKPAAKDMQQIKDTIGTRDYMAAVKILESARKE